MQLECWSIGFQEDEAMEEKKDKIWALKSMLQPQSEQKSCQINGPTVHDFDPLTWFSFDQSPRG